MGTFDKPSNTPQKNVILNFPQKTAPNTPHIPETQNIDEVPTNEPVPLFTEKHTTAHAALVKKFADPKNDDTREITIQILINDGRTREKAQALLDTITVQDRALADMSLKEYLEFRNLTSQEANTAYLIAYENAREKYRAQYPNAEPTTLYYQRKVDATRTELEESRKKRMQKKSILSIFVDFFKTE